MKLSAILVLLLFSISTVAAGPYPAVCTQLFKESKLAPYFDFQYNDYSCSLASSTPIFNSILAKLRGKQHKFIPQQAMLKKLKNPGWKRAVADGGDGLDLKRMRDYVHRGLVQLGIKNYEVKIFYLRDYTPEQLDRLLRKATKSKDDYVIMNFLQKEYTQNPLDTDGHFAPLGKYFPDQQRALVLDPDRGTGGAYYVDLKTMIRGMASIDEGSRLSRGLLWIRKFP